MYIGQALHSSGTKFCSQNGLLGCAPDPGSTLESLESRRSGLAQKRRTLEAKETQKWTIKLASSWHRKRKITGSNPCKEERCSEPLCRYFPWQAIFVIILKMHFWFEVFFDKLVGFISFKRLHRYNLFSMTRWGEKWPCGQNDLMKS
jgi:hypothetical protein